MVEGSIINFQGDADIRICMRNVRALKITEIQKRHRVKGGNYPNRSSIFPVAGYLANIAIHNEANLQYMDESSQYADDLGYDRAMLIRTYKQNHKIGSVRER